MAKRGNLANSFEATAYANNATFQEFYSRLKTLALSIFKWENLPNNIPESFIEKTLYYHGKVGFIYHPTLGYIATRIADGGVIGLYGEPTQYQVYTANGYYNALLDADDVVVIKNNRLSKNTHVTIQGYAQRLYEVERTTDVNIKSQKYPVLVLCDEEVRLSMKNIYMQYDGNTPFIFGDKKLSTRINGADGAFKVLNTGAPYVADKLNMYQRTKWNEALTFLGINNTDITKKERLVSDEANSNMEAVDMAAQTMLLTREEACDEINRKYGLNVSVKLRKFETMREVIELYEADAIEEEGEEIG